MRKPIDAPSYLTAIAIIIGIAMSVASTTIFHSDSEGYGDRYNNSERRGDRYNSKAACEAEGQAKLKAGTISGYTCTSTAW